MIHGVGAFLCKQARWQCYLAHFSFVATVLFGTFRKVTPGMSEFFGQPRTHNPFDSSMKLTDPSSGRKKNGSDHEGHDGRSWFGEWFGIAIMDLSDARRT